MSWFAGFELSGFVFSGFVRMLKRAAAFVLATCTPLPFAGEPLRLFPRDAQAAIAETATPFEPPSGPRAVGDLRGQRIVLAWTVGAFEYASVFTEVLVHATHEATPPLVLYEPSLDPEEIISLVREGGGDTDNLELIPTPLDTFWIRDFGPQVVATDEGHYLVDFPYDFERPNDDGVPALLAARFGLATRETAMDIEGGHLVVEGGVCITNDEVVRRGELLGWSKTAVTQELADLFGCRRIVFVPSLEGEPTGHVDLYVAATGAGRVVVGAYDAADDPTNATRLDRAARLLASAGLTVTRIPMPPNEDGTVFRSYTNLVVLPTTVLVPSYGDESSREEEAHEILRRELRGKTVVPVDVSSLIRLEGALHCIAITLPF